MIKDEPKDQYGNSTEKKNSNILEEAQRLKDLFFENIPSQDSQQSNKDSETEVQSGLQNSAEQQNNDTVEEGLSSYNLYQDEMLHDVKQHESFEIEESSSEDEDYETVQP